MEDAPLEPPPEIPSPGTPTFLSTLLSHIHFSATNTLQCSSFPIDPAVLQSILLCIVANKHLILRTAEEDIPSVVKLATLTLNSVFAYHPVHRLRIRPKALSESASLPTTNPDAFLRSVFLPSTRRNNEPLRRVESTLHSPLRHSRSGSGYTSPDEASLSTVQAEKNSRHHRHRSRSSSNHTASMQFMRSSYSSDLVMNNADGGVQGREIPGPASPTSLRQISFVSTSTGHKFPSTPLSPPHVHAELPPHRVESAHPPENPTVPHAIVVSGLEHASRLSQWALVRVLSEKRLVLDGGEDSDQDDAPNGPDGVWNLPDNFILVYVCASDPHERPGIHHSLLDKFAMSTTVTLQPATRNTVKAYRTHSNSCSTHGQSFRSSPSLSAMPLPIISPRPMYPGAHSPPNIRNPSPSLIRPPLTPLIPRPSSTPFMMDADPPPGLLPPTILPMLRTMFASKSELQISPHLLLYAADLFSAVRHHPQLEGTLLTTRSHTDALDLSRAARLLGIDLTGMEMIKLKLEENAVGCHGGMRHRSESETVDGTSNIEYGERMSDVYSGISSGMGLLSPFGDVDSRRSYEVRSPSFLTESAVSAREGDDEGESEALDVSEADIARIVPRVVSHRVRVRDGPQDEVLASLVFGAVPPTVPPEAWTRSSVKDIIISILAEV